MMTTQPSTMRPKSIAPRLIKLPEIFAVTMPVTATSMERGMASETTRPARKLPNRRRSTAMTSRPPSIRFLVTV